MKTLYILLIWLISIGSAHAETKLFKYSDFGPQAAVYELIGYNWYQWESHGGSSPEITSDVIVVVYWDEMAESVKKRFPINQSEKLDYRYLKKKRAIQHLEKMILEFKELDLDTKQLEITLGQLSKSLPC